MYFHIQLIDNPASPEKRDQSRADHWQYFDDHADKFIARGATYSDDMENFISSVLFMEFDGWDDVRHFIDNEPHNKNEVYKDVHIRRWNKGIDRTQSEFPRQEGQVGWYFRGYAKPDMHEKRMALLDQHIEYFAPYDVDAFITRGGVFNDDGSEWQGSANLICLRTRDAFMEFLKNEPFYVNGLYDHLLIERYKFGGRPGQVV
ncbi:MAG: hypothetical protein HQ503_06215 [Rhodospirillales bacterium]|nr:hypothetical protein [Rhodospirillales bacterium]